jgi:hypothetical protein
MGLTSPSEIAFSLEEYGVGAMKAKCCCKFDCFFCGRKERFSLPE